MSALRGLQAELGFELEERDITADDALQRAYFERIPVVALDGEELFEYVVDEDAAARASRVTAMSYGEPTASARRRAADGTGPSGERLSLGVAARLSRYLQVLTQAKKMGKETISSQELSDYTHVNSTQIRRDLSGFGKFGKRGVGYNVEALVSQIRKILRTAGQHNIALLGAGHLGQGDRLLGHLRRPRLPRRGDLRRGPRQGRHAGRQPGRAPHRRAAPGRRGRGHRRGRARGARRRPRRGSPTSSSTPA